MSLLVVSATPLEASELARSRGGGLPSQCPPGTLIKGKNEDFLISGVGSALTAYWLGTVLAGKHYRGVMNIGIAGSFSKKFERGSVYRVDEEIFGDLGAARGPEFRDIFDLKLESGNSFPFKDGVLRNRNPSLLTPASAALTPARSITVNAVLEDPAAIAHVKSKYAPDLVNMEGAAVFYACLAGGIPFIEVRSVSDFAGPRADAKWDIKNALSALTVCANGILDELR